MTKHHDRQQFTCGNLSLDAYLKTQASQDMRRKANAVFVLTAETAPVTILGYFTLCAFGISPGDIPEEARKHIPRDPVVSVTLIGRLAVSETRQGKGIGAILLAEGIRKAYANADVVGSSMIVVDAIDDRAIRFYQAHGFIRLPESMRLILPMQTVAALTTSAKTP